MTEPQPSPLRGLEDIFQKGLGLFNNGVDQLSTAISTADTSVRKVDGSLTGGVPGGVPGTLPAVNPQTIPQDGQVVSQVMTLARQGQQAAQEAGNLQSPRVAEAFQQLMRLIFNPSIARTDALQDLLPSPAQALQMGMRDLRGSVALVRLANGTGTPDDLVAVVGFAESLMGRVSGPLNPPAAVTPAVASSPAPPTAVTAAAPAAAEAPAGGKKPRKPRKSRSRKKKELDPQTVALAKAVAAEIGDAELTQAATDFGDGNLTEARFQKKMAAVADEKGVDLDLMLNRATEKMNVPS